MTGRSNRRKTLLLGSAAVTAAALTMTACSSSGGSSGSSGSGGAFKPARPVTFVVDNAPGGGGDIFARAVASGFEAGNSGLKIAVVNKTGGEDVVGDSYVLGMKNSPYYVSVQQTGLLTVPFSVTPPPDYTWKSFTPIAEMAEDQAMFVVNAKSPYQNLTDFLAAAKASSKTMRVGVSSTGSAAYAVVRLVESAQSLKFTPVSLNSGSGSVAALLANNVDFAVLNPSEVLGQLQAGKLRAIAVFSDKRYAAGTGLENVPTATEQGVNIVLPQWRGIFGPPGMSAAAVAYYQKAAEAWTQSQSYKDYISKNALEPAFKTGADFVNLLQTQSDQLQTALAKAS